MVVCTGVGCGAAGADGVVVTVGVVGVGAGTFTTCSVAFGVEIEGVGAVASVTTGVVTTGVITGCVGESCSLLEAGWAVVDVAVAGTGLAVSPCVEAEEVLGLTAGVGAAAGSASAGGASRETGAGADAGTGTGTDGSWSLDPGVAAGDVAAAERSAGADGCASAATVGRRVAGVATRV